MIVGFRSEASARTGLGHVARCSALAHELSRRRVRVRLACRDLSPLAGELLDRAGVEVVRLPGGPTDDEEADADETAAALGSVDWMVVDHYGLGTTWERRALERCADRLLVIEDLADRAHEADILIDPNLDAPDRCGLLPARALQLRGPMFALLRPEFGSTVPPERPERRGLLVSLGGGDDGGATSVIVDALLLQAPDRPLHAVATSSAGGAMRLRELADGNPQLEIHVDTMDMADLMANAGLMVGAGGSSSWERCALGLPALTLSIADNQDATAQALARRRASIHAGRMADVALMDVANAALRMLDRPSLLARMGTRARALCDGRGASRVADLLGGAAVR